MTHVETDVRATADGVLVVFHDDRLERLTELEGPVAGVRWADLRAAGLRGGVPVPVLADVLSAWPRLRINVDLKADGRWPLRRARARDGRGGPGVHGLVQRAAPTRRRPGPGRLGTPAHSLGFTASARFVGLAAAGAPVRVLRRALAGAVALQLPDRAGVMPVVTRRLVRAVHAAGAQVHVWTVDEPAGCRSCSVSAWTRSSPTGRIWPCRSRRRRAASAPGQGRHRHRQGEVVTVGATGSGLPQDLLDPASRRREQRSWYVYDWANSAYVTTTLTVLFGSLPHGRRQAGGVPRAALGRRLPSQPLGARRPRQPRVPRALRRDASPRCCRRCSCPSSAPSWTAPGASGRRSRASPGWARPPRRRWLVRGDNWVLGVVLMLVASLALGCSLVVYDAILIDIATPDERDRVSSRGWAVGYAGGGLLLALNLVLVQGHDAFGLSQEAAVRLSLLSAGVWWGAFTLVPYLGLRDRPPRDVVPEPGAGWSGRRSGSSSPRCGTCAATRRRCASCWRTCSSTTASRR